MENIRIGVIGVSGRGSGMLGELLDVPGVTVPAVCDKYEDRAQNGRKIVKEKAGYDADAYTDYKELLARNDIDAVMISLAHSR